MAKGSLPRPRPPVSMPQSPLQKIQSRYHTADRGKPIMACGIGKTFTSLKIAEEVAGKNKRALFLVPSLNLLSQTLTEWTRESAIPLHSFVVCSDVEVGNERNKDEDIVETFAHELRYPATPCAKRLAVEMAKRHDAQHMSVVSSIYHSRLYGFAIEALQQLLSTFLLVGKNSKSQILSVGRSRFQFDSLWCGTLSPSPFQ